MLSISIVVIERQAIFLDALSLLFEEKPDLNIVASAASLDRGGLQAIVRHKPDVVLLNMVGLRHRDSACFENIRASSKASRIIIMADRLEPDSIRTAFENDVRGYFLREEGKLDLYRCINDVMTGHTYMSKRVSDLVVSGYAHLRRQNADNAAERELTTRETEIVTLVAEGMTNRKCASRLGISVKTVEKYRARAMQKLNLSNSAQLANYAIKAGLLSLPDTAT